MGLVFRDKHRLVELCIEKAGNFRKAAIIWERGGDKEMAEECWKYRKLYLDLSKRVEDHA